MTAGGRCRSAETELESHELVKVRIGENAPGDRHEIAAELAQRTNAELTQVIGRTALLYRARERPDDRASLIADSQRLRREADYRR